MLIFEREEPGRHAQLHCPDLALNVDAVSQQIPEALRRTSPIGLPDVAELQVVRHYTQLSQKNFSIDTHLYPLGSCTMKYNPRASHSLASLPGFACRHPFTSVQHGQGTLACLYELQTMLIDATGMQAISLTPMAGAQGEMAGINMIKAYHHDRGDFDRDEVIVPDAAHGTNPASAIRAGFKVKEIKTGPDGDIDLVNLEAALSDRTAGIMLTNPSTLGVFERKITTIAEKVHAAGGLLYYDGANLNAILGRARPGDMGFDVMHLNLHKTFATPHGGGGPGAGPVAVGERLAPYLPTPMVGYDEARSYPYYWLTEVECPKSIGRLSAFMGNVGILLRAHSYARLLGWQGMRRVGDYATLNANYVMKRLAAAGFTLAYPKRRATHEFILTLNPENKTYQVSAFDVAKRLLDFGFHAPTTYFPLLIPECLLIEPTETEAKCDLDRFVDVMVQILSEIKESPDTVRKAPHSMPVRRLDDVKAAREIDVAWKD